MPVRHRQEHHRKHGQGGGSGHAPGSGRGEHPRRPHEEGGELPPEQPEETRPAAGGEYAPDLSGQEDQLTEITREFAEAADLIEQIEDAEAEAQEVELAEGEMSEPPPDIPAEAEDELFAGLAEPGYASEFGAGSEPAAGEPAIPGDEEELFEDLAGAEAGEEPDEALIIVETEYDDEVGSGEQAFEEAVISAAIDAGLLDDEDEDEEEGEAEGEGEGELEFVEEAAYDDELMPPDEQPLQEDEGWPASAAYDDEFASAGLSAEDELAAALEEERRLAELIDQVTGEAAPATGEYDDEALAAEREAEEVIEDERLAEALAEEQQIEDLAEAIVEDELVDELVEAIDQEIAEEAAEHPDQPSEVTLKPPAAHKPGVKPEAQQPAQQHVEGAGAPPKPQPGPRPPAGQAEAGAPPGAQPPVTSPPSAQPPAVQPPEVQTPVAPPPPAALPEQAAEEAGAAGTIPPVSPAEPRPTEGVSAEAAAEPGPGAPEPPATTSTVRETPGTAAAAEQAAAAGTTGPAAPAQAPPLAPPLAGAEAFAAPAAGAAATAQSDQATQPPAAGAPTGLSAPMEDTNVANNPSQTAIQDLNTALDQLITLLNNPAVATAFGQIPSSIKQPIKDGLNKVLGVITDALNELKKNLGAVTTVHEVLDAINSLLTAAEGLAPGEKETLDSVKTIVGTLQGLPSAADIDAILNKIQTIIGKLQSL